MRATASDTGDARRSESVQRRAPAAHARNVPAWSARRSRA